LVNTLTVSQAQLDEFRAVNLDAPVWIEPLDQALYGRLVQTNLKQLPLDDKFIPAFHPHGPPLNVIDPSVDGTVINPAAVDAEDAAYKNYWSAFDYTIVDDATAPPSLTGPVASTADVAAVTAPTADAGTADGTAPSTSGGGGASAFLLEQALVASGGTTPVGGTAQDVSDTGTTGGVIPAPTGGNVLASTTNAPQTDDHHVDIPNFFHLSTVAYYTPDFAPKRHNGAEDNHYQPPSADTDSDVMPDDQTQFRGKRGQQTLNPAPQPAHKNEAKKVALPQMKQQKKPAALTRAAAPTPEAKSPRAAFQSRRHWK